MHPRALVLSVAFLAAPAAGQDPNPPPGPDSHARPGKSETVRLFDGRSLDGWDGYRDNWSVRDGAIVGRSGATKQVATYLISKAKFRDFRLTFAAKLVESEQHSALCFWGEAVKGVDWAPDAPRSDHTYVGHSITFPKTWGLYELGGRKAFTVDKTAARRVGKPHDWNDIELLARGDRVRVAVNGTATLDWREPEPNRIKPGPIGLQLHCKGFVQEVHFKGLALETDPAEDRLLTVTDAGPAPAPVRPR